MAGHTDAQRKAIHSKGSKSHAYNGGPVKHNDKSGHYEYHCTHCDKGKGGFAGADHAREAYENHKESH